MEVGRKNDMAASLTQRVPHPRSILLSPRLPFDPADVVLSGISHGLLNVVHHASQRLLKGNKRGYFGRGGLQLAAIFIIPCTVVQQHIRKHTRKT